MLPNLGSMHAIVIFDTRDIKLSVVCIRSTLHRGRTQFLDTQLVAETYPAYCAGIADKNFELVDLKKNFQCELQVKRSEEVGENFLFYLPR